MVYSRLSPAMFLLGGRQATQRPGQGVVCSLVAVQRVQPAPVGAPVVVQQAVGILLVVVLE
eukprot:4752722-Pyramimonas_sp.AAC.1